MCVSHCGPMWLAGVVTCQVPACSAQNPANKHVWSGTIMQGLKHARRCDSSTQMPVIPSVCRGWTISCNTSSSGLQLNASACCMHLKQQLNSGDFITTLRRPTTGPVVAQQSEPAPMVVHAKQEQQEHRSVTGAKDIFARDPRIQPR